MPVLAPPVAAGELGLTGTANFAGDILSESNAKLTYTSAFGVAGSRTWGEWEKLLRTNPFVSMALDFIMGPIRDARFGVKPAVHESLDPVEAQKHADFVRWNLAEHVDPSPAEWAPRTARAGLNYGFSFDELVWGAVSHPALPGGIGNGLVKLAERLPSTVVNNAWLEGPDGLRAVQQRGPNAEGKYVYVEIPAEKLSLFTWDRSGNNYTGFSVWRPVWYIAQIQAELLRLIGISSTREGAGIPTAVSNSDKAVLLTDGQRKKLQRLLENLVYHENAAVVMPAGWDIKWVFSPGANKGHVLDAWTQLGTVILQTVGAQQLALGVHNTGSRAVGQTHDGQSLVFVQGVVSLLESTLNGVGRRKETGVVRKLVDANFGPQVAYPTVNFALKRPQLDPKDRTAAMAAAVTAGALTITADDENAVREDLGLAPIDPAVREEERAKKAALAPKLPTPGAATPVEPDGDEEPDEDDAQEAPAKMSRLGSSAPAPGFTPRRALRAAESRLDLARMNTFLNTAREKFERAVKPIAVAMLAHAAPAIHAAMADGDPSELARLKLDTKRLDAAVSDFLEMCRVEGAKQVRAELARGSAASLVKKRNDGDQSMAPTTATRLAAEEEDDKDKPGAADDEDTQALLDAQQAAVVRRIETRLKAELEDEAIDAVRTGEGSDEVIQRTLANQLETQAFRSDAGFVLTKAWNAGRDQMARQLGGVASVEYSAILDGRQCDSCDSMDGQTAAFDSAEHDAMVPPNRDCDGGNNCRCLLAYVPADDSEDGGDE